MRLLGGMRAPLAVERYVAMVAIGVTVLSAWMLALGSSSAAAAPPVLWTACDGGAADTQCSIARGVAVDSDNGHVFVSDQLNYRIVEFNGLGQMVKTWGWDVVESGPGNSGTGFEICVPAAGDLCKAGTTGTGAGQFGLSGPQGVAVDPAGDVYVVDLSGLRVQKFSPEGEFLLMFGAEVNKTTKANICTKADLEGGDECGAGVEGTASGQFGAWAVGSFIAITSAGKVYVGDQGRIQRFDAAGVYQDECAVAGTVQSLDVDAAGNLYVVYESQPDIRKITPGCVELEEPRFELPKLTPFHTPIPFAVAVDAAGHVFAFGVSSFDSGSRNPLYEFDQDGKLVDEFGKGQFDSSTGLAANLCEGSEPPGNLFVTNASPSNGFLRAYGTPPFGCFKARTLPATNVEETSATLNGTVNPDGFAVSECRFEYGTDEGYGQQIDCEETPAQIGTGTEPVPVHADVSGLTGATFYHFRLSAIVGGETEAGADEEFKTKGPPVISDDHTASVTDTEAILKARINPEGLETTYRFEYGLSTAYGQSTQLRSAGADRSEHSVSAILEGLEPNTTYHWRIVASNSSDAAEGEDHAFTTNRPLVAEPDSCPNKTLRGGAAALLPDCRAYEMVSPLDKNGGDITRTGVPSGSDPGSYVQVSPNGDRLTYTTGTSFAEQPSSFDFNQYLATREEEGWSSQGIHPPVVNRPADSGLFGHLRDFMAFTPDLCDTWLIDYQTPPLTEDAQPDHRNLFRRHNCEPGVGELEALMPVPEVELPEGTDSGKYVEQDSVQGISEDGRHAVFVANAALIPQAAPHDEDGQVYDRFEGALRVVSVLPHGGADPSSAVVGSGWLHNLEHAVSENGSRAYWTSLSGGSSRSIGAIYLRTNPEQAQSSQVLGSATGAGNLSGPTSAKGKLVSGSIDVTEVDPPFGAFKVGQGIEGAGIAPGTTVAKVGFGTLKLSAPASASGSGVALTGLASKEVKNVTTTTGAFAVGQTIAGEGIPLGTTIAAIGEGTLTLSAAATETRTANALEAFSECAEPEKACTVPVSEGDNAFFWAASPDGSAALYSEGDFEKGEATLHEFRLEGPGGEPVRRVVAEDVRGVAGNSEDLSRVYFASEEALPEAGQNSEDEEAQAGEPNLYLQDGETLRFVATLIEGDLGIAEAGGAGMAYDVASGIPFFRATRATPDGSRLAFQSRTPLTGFDNTDTNTGEPAVEVYLYEVGGELTCVSCNPSGARPSGQELEIPYMPRGVGTGTDVFAAAWIPTWEHPLHASNVLSEDGQRLFFNSYDALLPRDTNGAMDVYEWEEAGKGSCDEEDPNYSPQNGGCLYLISSGDSPHESEFWEATPDGEDVFFTTASSFAPGDPGLVDLYDARAGGGIPFEPPPVECEGEACASPPPPPEFGAPASSTYSGPENEGKPAAKRCRKGKRRVRKAGKVRCVKKRRAHRSRRAGR
jgi:NHL repeat-containing protein